MRYLIIPLVLLTIASHAMAQESNDDLALAEAYYAQEDWENAARSYDQVRREEAEAPFVLEKLAYSLMRCKLDMRAEKVLNRLLDLQPDNDVAHFNLGLLYWRTGRPLMAISSFEVVIGIDPDWPAAWLCLGYVLAELERIDEAWRMFDTLYELDPEVAEELHAEIRWTEKNMADPVSDW